MKGRTITEEQYDRLVDLIDLAKMFRASDTDKIAVSVMEALNLVIA